MILELEEKFYKAVLLYKSGKINKSEAFFKELIKKMPKNDDILFYLAMICVSRDQTAGLLEIYNKKLITINGKPDYYKELGNIYFQKGNYEGAKESYFQALRLNPITLIYSLISGC